MFCKKGVLGNFPKFTGKHLRQSLFFNKVAGPSPATSLKRETLAQVFSCEFCEIFQEHLFYRTPLDVCFCTLKTYLKFCEQVKWNAAISGKVRTEIPGRSVANTSKQANAENINRSNSLYTVYSLTIPRNISDDAFILC